MEFIIPSGYRELAKGEKINRQTDRYYDIATPYGAKLTNYVWAVDELVYGQGVLSNPRPGCWMITRPIENVDNSWVEINKTPHPIGKRALFSDGKRIRVGTYAFSADSHWQELPPLPVTILPDVTYDLNTEHRILVKGDKSGVLVGPSRDSFVPAATVKEIAAQLKPATVPDSTVRLNSDHSIIVKGDKSGIIVGCSKDSFVSAYNVQELAALL